MPIERRDVETSLSRKGFKASDRDHHYFIYHTIGGLKTTVWTKTSHGSGYKTLDDSLVGKMARQCGLTGRQFRQLIDCPLSREDLETILAQTGRIHLG